MSIHPFEVTDALALPQEPGLGINNENASCPEVSQVVEAFKSIMTIVTSANLTIGWGDLDITRKVYEDPLILFTKLDNTRGVRRLSLEFEISRPLPFLPRTGQNLEAGPDAIRLTWR